MSRWTHTHEALRRAALELFSEQGYDATGTAQVAARAGVSEMTLFRHFSSKDALLLEDPFDPLMADAVRARPADEAPMRAVAEGVREVWREVHEGSLESLRSRLRIVAESATLHGAVERNSAATVSALAEALTGRGVGAAQARVAAAAVVAGLSTALLAWARDEGAVLEDMLGRALDVLGGR